MNPKQVALLGLIGGAVFTFGVNAARDWLAARGKRDVDKARDALRKAKLSPDKSDDALADLALAKALEDKATYDWWIEQLGRVKPPVGP